MATPLTLQERLGPLVGEWDMETSLAPAGTVAARTSFTWALDGRYLIQRSEIQAAQAPDLLAIIAEDPASGQLTQHYFDSRGTIRLYAMSFETGIWTLRREAADFTPLAFAQQYIGTLSDDGMTIEGHWESRSPDASDWTRDFELTYKRIAA